MRTFPRSRSRYGGCTASTRTSTSTRSAPFRSSCESFPATSSSRSSRWSATTCFAVSQARLQASSTIPRQSSRTPPSSSLRSAASCSARRAGSTRSGSRQRSWGWTCRKTRSAICSHASRSSGRRSADSSATMNSGSSRVADYDAVLVGSGINSLACAAFLARGGWRVAVLEREAELGGAVRTAELTEPGFHHDVFSAWHPLWVGGPAHAELGAALAERGLEYLNTEHPTGTLLPDGTGAFLTTNTDANAAELERHAAGG